MSPPGDRDGAPRSPAPREDPFRLVGQVLEGRYRVDATVAEGGFGVVYKGFHFGFESPIAIKVLKLPARLADAERDAFLATFRAEGKILFELSRVHPGFVRPIETGFVVTVDGTFAPFLILEWLEGRSLDQELFLRRREGAPRPSLEEVLNELTPIAEALIIAHERGVAHRDVKPANVFLTPSGAKLLDFGIAKVMSDGTLTSAPANPTTSGLGAFTPGYAAPEQWLRKLGSTGPWTDVYAFALLVVERMTGKPALLGDDPQQLMGATIDAEDRPIPSARGAVVPPVVDTVFKRALAVDPHARYRSMKTFWSSLVAASRGMADDTTEDANASENVTSAPRTAPSQPSSPSFARVSSSGALHADANTALASNPTELAEVPRFPMTTRAVTRSNRPAVRSSRWVVSALLVPAALVSAGALYYLKFRDTSSPVAPPPPTTKPTSSPVPGEPCSPEMALIKGATFSMGSENGESDERPVHPVRVSSFCLDRTEMLRVDYARCKGCPPPFAGPERAPVVGVDFLTAVSACDALGKRLPTEAEWELAARGPEGRLYPWGNEQITCERAAVARVGNNDCMGGISSPGAHLTGATPEGVQDMAGNVWEWVSDLYGPYVNATAPPIDPSGPTTGTLHILRGGSWSQGGQTAHSTNRVALGKNERLVDAGIRCAKKAAF